MTDFDVVIIGAGVVGLAIAARLAGGKRRLAVLEKNERYGQETSARNSEVIHGGIYYPSPFLKTRLCVAGRRLLYRWCRDYGVPCRRVGKLIVATTAGEMACLERLRLQALENDVEGVRFVGRRELTVMEPEVRAVGALFSPETGILDSHLFMRSLLAAAEEKSAILSCRSEVTAVHWDGKIYVLEINGGTFYVRTGVTINSAGLRSDAIAAMVGIDINKAGYRLKYCKGDYFHASPKPRLTHLIYPVPDQTGLGIHATLDFGGRVRFGPDTEYVNILDYRVDEKKRTVFHRAVRRYLPSLPEEALHPDTCGIRPKLQGPDDPPRDFVIQNGASWGLPGFINLIGIDSPGLTASLAIADEVAAEVESLI